MQAKMQDLSSSQTHCRDLSCCYGNEYWKKRQRYHNNVIVKDRSRRSSSLCEKRK